MTLNIGDTVRVTDTHGTEFAGMEGVVIDPSDGNRWRPSDGIVYVEIPDYDRVRILPGFGDRPVGAFGRNDLTLIQRKADPLPDNILPIGTRVVIQQTPRGNVNPAYIGETAEVIGHYGTPPSSHQIRLDDETLSGGGSWSTEALCPLPLEEPAASYTIKPGVRVRCVDGGAGFPGLTGTVSDERFVSLDNFRIIWDRQPDPEVNSTGDGGSWSERNVEIITDADIVDPDDVDGSSDDPDHVSSREYISDTDFYIGQRVEVHGYGHSWDGPATVARGGYDSNIIVQSDHKEGLGGFENRFIRPLDDDELRDWERELLGTLDGNCPSFDIVESAGLDGTSRDAGPYSWEDVARAALSDRDELSREYAGFRTQWADDRAALELEVSAQTQRKVDAEAEAVSLRQRLNQSNAALDYALDLLDATERSRVFGYLDGVKAGL